MPYSVHALAKLANVSVRTLHYYDEVGLVRPTRAKRNGYRQYEAADLLKLQQILFFRELDFSLDDIKRIVLAKSFDPKVALLDQRHLLGLKKKRLGNLIRTIDKTIRQLDTKRPMQDEELYEALSKEDEEAYAKEAKERWGNTEMYKQSQERYGRLTKEEKQKLKDDGEAFMKRVADTMKQGPKSASVQALIAQHYDALRAFYEPNLELYRGLANMYVSDPRFGAYYTKRGVDPKEMREAMLAYVEAEEARG